MLILLTKRPQPQQMSARDLLQIQNCVFETLLTVLRRLDPRLHKPFIVKSLTIILDLQNLNELPMVSLAELLFSLLDGCTEPGKTLDLQNVLIYASQEVERNSDKSLSVPGTEQF